MTHHAYFVSSATYMQGATAYSLYSSGSSSSRTQKSQCVHATTHVYAGIAGAQVHRCMQQHMYMQAPQVHRCMQLYMYMQAPQVHATTHVYAGTTGAGGGGQSEALQGVEVPVEEVRA